MSYLPFYWMSFETFIGTGISFNMYDQCTGVSKRTWTPAQLLTLCKCNSDAFKRGGGGGYADHSFCCINQHFYGTEKTRVDIRPLGIYTPVEETVFKKWKYTKKSISYSGRIHIKSCMFLLFDWMKQSWGRFLSLGTILQSLWGHLNHTKLRSDNQVMYSDISHLQNDLQN